jgi:hypothetical protein
LKNRNGKGRGKDVRVRLKDVDFGVKRRLEESLSKMNINQNFKVN